MADLDSTPEEERVACRALRALIYETLHDLKYRVDFLHDNWHGTSDEEKAQFSWCLMVGVLTHEVGAAVVTLIEADQLRAAKILGRSLFEYHLRLRIYEQDAAEALHDAIEAPKELRRFLATRPSRDRARFHMSDEELAQFEAFLAQNQGKIRLRRVIDDVKTVNPGDNAQAIFEYYGLYGFSSALAHGSGLILKEIVHSNNGIDTFLAWRSLYLKPLLTTGEACYRIIGILQAIEETSGYFQAHVVLNRKYAEIMRPIAERLRRRPA